jgi:hypothetical protein
MEENSERNPKHEIEVVLQFRDHEAITIPATVGEFAEPEDDH